MSGALRSFLVRSQGIRKHTWACSFYSLLLFNLFREFKKPSVPFLPHFSLFSRYSELEQALPCEYTHSTRDRFLLLAG